MPATMETRATVAETLTQAELAAPFVIAPADAEPLEEPTREAVIVEGEAILVVGYIGRIGHRRQWISGEVAR